MIIKIIIILYYNDEFLWSIIYLIPATFVGMQNKVSVDSLNTQADENGPSSYMGYVRKPRQLACCLTAVSVRHVNI